MTTEKKLPERNIAKEKSIDSCNKLKDRLFDCIISLQTEIGYDFHYSEVNSVFLEFLTQSNNNTLEYINED